MVESRIFGAIQLLEALFLEFGICLSLLAYSQDMHNYYELRMALESFLG